MTRVKICGITSAEDARTAYECGADYLGFIFIEGTPRAMTAEGAGLLKRELGETPLRGTGMVGLFRDAHIEKVLRTIGECGLDHVQLQGEEDPAYCERLKSRHKEMTGRDIKIIKAFKVRGAIMPSGGVLPGEFTEADLYVFDTYHPELSGGTGHSFDWDRLAGVKDELEKPFFVAGGLHPENVAEAVARLMPFGVDVSSGVETSPGKKDPKKIKEFIDNAKKNEIT